MKFYKSMVFGVSLMAVASGHAVIEQGETYKEEVLTKPHSTQKQSQQWTNTQIIQFFQKEGNLGKKPSWCKRFWIILILLLRKKIN